MAKSYQMSFAKMIGIVDTFVAAMPVDTKVHLFKGNLVPDKNTTYAQILAEAPVGSWYAPVTAVFLQDFRNENGDARMECQSVQFNYSGSDAPETVTGAALMAVSTTTLFACRQLDTPFTLSDSYASATVTVAVDFPVPSAT